MVYAKVDIVEKFNPPFSEPAGFINRLLPNIFLLAGIIAFLLLVGGGFMMIQGASSGDAEQVGRGKKALTYAIIGLIIIFGSFLLIKFITGLTMEQPIF